MVIADRSVSHGTMGPIGDPWDPSLPHDRNDRTGVSAEKRKKTVNSREDREIANTHLVFSKRQKKRPSTVFSQKDREIRKKDR